MQKDIISDKEVKNTNKQSEFVPLTYAEIIPDFNSYNKNKKKKLRK